MSPRGKDRSTSPRGRAAAAKPAEDNMLYPSQAKAAAKPDATNYGRFGKALDEPGAGAAKPEMTSFGNFGNNGSLGLPGIGGGAAKPEATAYGKFGVASIPAATGAPVDGGLGASAGSPVRAASSQSPTRPKGKTA